MWEINPCCRHRFDWEFEEMSQEEQDLHDSSVMNILRFYKSFHPVRSRGESLRWRGRGGSALSSRRGKEPVIPCRHRQSQESTVSIPAVFLSFIRNALDQYRGKAAFLIADVVRAVSPSLVPTS